MSKIIQFGNSSTEGDGLSSCVGCCVGEREGEGVGVCVVFGKTVGEGVGLVGLGVDTGLIKG